MVSEITKPSETRILSRGNWMDESGEIVQHQRQLLRAYIGTVEPFGFGAAPRQIA